jgi:hypothetical protein
VNLGTGAVDKLRLEDVKIKRKAEKKQVDL